MDTVASPRYSRGRRQIPSTSCPAAIPCGGVTEGAPPSAPAPSTRDVLRRGPVAALLASQLQFTMAFSIQATALGKQIFDITGRELDLGFLGLAEFLPSFLLVLVTGSVADRLDKRRVVSAALVLELVCSLSLAGYARSDPSAVGPIFALGAGFGVARAFHAPAERALKPLVAPPDLLPRVVALHSTTWQLGAIAGPVTAGFLYTVSPVAPYLASGVLSAGALVAMLALRYAVEPAPSHDRPTLHSALEGLRVIRSTPVLLGAISLDLFAVLFGGAVALLPAIAEKRLGVGAVGLGFLRSSVGVGAALTAVVLANRPLVRAIGRTLFAAVAMFGVLTIALGLTRSFAVAVVVLAALSAADMVSVFIRATLVPFATPPYALGRVHAVEQVFIGASNELGAFESGVAASLLGLTPAVVLGGAATLVVAGLWTVLFPALRSVDRFDDVRVW